MNNIMQKTKEENGLSCKVPQITIFFWIIKVLTTGMGEVTSDYLGHTLDPVIAVQIAGCGLIMALIIQIFISKYIPWMYWVTVIMVSIFGTMAADVLHVLLGIPYIASTIFFLTALSFIFLIWYKVEKSLSVHSIYTKRRELFYWLTVLTTFALGTATGDMTASTMHLGYFFSGAFFGIIILLPAIAYLFFNCSEVVTFWLAYIITRPLGASFADWLGAAKSLDGMGLGSGTVSLILTILIFMLLLYLSVTKKDLNKK